MGHRVLSMARISDVITGALNIYRLVCALAACAIIFGCAGPANQNSAQARAATHVVPGNALFVFTYSGVAVYNRDDFLAAPTLIKCEGCLQGAQVSGELMAIAEGPRLVFLNLRTGRVEGEKWFESFITSVVPDNVGGVYVWMRTNGIAKARRGGPIRVRTNLRVKTISSIASAPNGMLAVVSGSEVDLYDALLRKKLRTLKPRGTEPAIAFGKDGTLYVLTVSNSEGNGLLAELKGGAAVAREHLVTGVHGGAFLFVDQFDRLYLADADCMHQEKPTVSVYTPPSLSSPSLRFTDLDEVKGIAVAEDGTVFISQGACGDGGYTGVSVFAKGKSAASYELDGLGAPGVLFSNN